jgi:aspartate racemase
MGQKIVGIIGGMGPEATVDLMQRIIKATPALDDQDHIRLLVDNNPKIPSRIKALVDGSGESPGPVMAAMARRLAAWGADLLAIPCNTAHYFLREVQDAVAIPVLNMINITCARILEQKPAVRRVGLLASTAVIKTALYKDALDVHGVDMIQPPEASQNTVLAIIRAIKAGRLDADHLEGLDTIAHELIERRAEAILIACTELSIVSQKLRLPVSLYDSAQILAEVIVAEAMTSFRAPRTGA